VVTSIFSEVYSHYGGRWWYRIEACYLPQSAAAIGGYHMSRVYVKFLYEWLLATHPGNVVAITSVLFG
jgi:hypothetical protein